MIEIRRATSATPKEVFAVLADGWVYPTWVVGASRVRAVDARWPAAGAQVHLSFGLWPVMLGETTRVLAVAEPHRLVLRASSGTLGATTVEIQIDGWGEGSLVTITEDISGGPGRWVPEAVRQPLLAVRNRETMRRLLLVAEGRAGKSAAKESDVQ